MTNAREDEYLLGTRDAELTRLGFQHRVWAKYAFALWERAEFRPGQTILDLGCGPGFATLDLAALVGPEGRVIAIDESNRFVTYLKEQCRSRGLDQVDARIGDAHHLDLPPNSLDGAYLRWVLCFVSDPAEVIAGVSRALKPGAVLAIMDYYNYPALTLAPRSAAMDRVVRAVMESWKDSGGDLDIMLRVPSLLVDAGLTLTHVHPIVRIAKPGSALWHWPVTFFENFLPVLVERGYLLPQERDAFQDDLLRRDARNPALLLSTPPMLEILATRS